MQGDTGLIIITPCTQEVITSGIRQNGRQFLSASWDRNRQRMLPRRRLFPVVWEGSFEHIQRVSVRPPQNLHIVYYLNTIVQI